MSEEAKVVEATGSEIKFTEDEMTELKQVQETYVRIQNDLGALSVQEIQVSSQLEAIGDAKVQLETLYKENKQKEINLAKTLTEKYGDGNLDLETGTFTPNTANS